jgi:ABC-type multidrug transport system fused ATPase/permease subunit
MIKQGNLSNLPIVFSRVLAILNPKQKKTGIYIFLMMLLGMVLETIGVASIFPLITILQDPKRIESLSAIIPAGSLELLLSHTNGTRVIALMLLIAVFFIVKNTFLAVLSYRQAKFAFGLQSDISQRLFSIYIRQSYLFHLDKNSAQLIRNTTTEVNAVTFNLILPALYLSSEVLVVCGLAALLLWLEPIGALTALGVLGIAGFIFHLATSRRAQECGKSRQYHEGQRIQHLQQGFGAIKEVKLLGCENEFLSRFHVHAEAYARAGRTNVTLQQLPKLWVEMLAILGLFLLIITMLAQGREYNTLIPTLGLFAAAAFRLMPSISRILTYLQNIKFATPVIDLLYAEIVGSNPIEKLGINKSKVALESPNQFLELKNLSYSYPGMANKAINKLSLKIMEFETIGIYGSSGSGKTTLIDLILGLLEPASGLIAYSGISIFEDIRAWQKTIGYVPQSIFLTDDTILRNIAFGIPDNLIDINTVWDVLEAAQLSDFVKTLPEGLNTITGERGVKLSGGQRQRVGLARALYRKPKVLVLDEATSALDTQTEEGVMSAIGRLHNHMTIIIVAHRISTFKYCDNVFRLESGEIHWAGKYNDLAVETAFNSSYFGT